MRVLAAAIFAALVMAGPAAAWNDCGYHHKPKPPVVTPVPPVTQPAGPVRVCGDGLPPDAGKDGHVPASGNGNDDCDHTGDPRLG